MAKAVTTVAVVAVMAVEVVAAMAAEEEATMEVVATKGFAVVAMVVHHSTAHKAIVAGPLV